MAASRSLAWLLAIRALAVAVLTGVEAAAVCEEAAATSDEAWELCPVLGEELADGCCKDAEIAKLKEENAKLKAAGSWDGYRIVSDSHLTLKLGPARYFTHVNVKKWQAMMKTAFSRDPLFHFNQKVGYDYKTKKAARPFQSHSDCLKFYEQKTREFGTCGTAAGGDPEWWLRYGCPYLNEKPSLCVGTWSKAGNPWAKRPALKGTVAETARYVERKSTIDGGNRSFYAVTVKGRTYDSTSCSLDFFVRIGVCANCCCDAGLIQYEVASDSGKDVTEACRDWSITAVAGLSNFFSMWRLEESIKVSNRCLRSNTKCNNQAARNR